MVLPTPEPGGVDADQEENGKNNNMFYALQGMMVPTSEPGGVDAG